jgi:hypothetical protein
MSEEIAVGVAVVTADGRELGHVKEVAESAFLVDAPRQLDYWLDKELVTKTGADRLELNIVDSDLGAYKMDRPHDHNEFRAQVPQQLDPNTVRGRTY